MLVTKLFKSSIYIIALSVISVGGAILIHSVLAYTGPTTEPPDGNVSVIGGWTGSGTNIYLSTLTNNVGIGTDSPNKQLHVATASGNAELNIQSVDKNYWAIYHDETTEQLRFWNTDFVGNIDESGVGNAFIIGNDGTVLVKTPVDGGSDNAVATKGYVDASGGSDLIGSYTEYSYGDAITTVFSALNEMRVAIESISSNMVLNPIQFDTAPIISNSYLLGWTSNIPGVNIPEYSHRTNPNGGSSGDWSSYSSSNTSISLASVTWSTGGTIDIAARDQENPGGSVYNNTYTFGGHVCGDDIIDAALGESCDDGSENGDPNKCNTECTGATTSVCGNSILEGGEACEYTLTPQGCTTSCTATTCCYSADSNHVADQVACTTPGTSCSYRTITHCNGGGGCYNDCPGGYDWDGRAAWLACKSPSWSEPTMAGTDSCTNRYVAVSSTDAFCDTKCAGIGLARMAANDGAGDSSSNGCYYSGGQWTNYPGTARMHINVPGYNAYIQCWCW